MGFYKVRPGQMIGQSGKDFKAGDVIELNDMLAHELRDKVDPCMPDGTVLETPVAITDAQLASVKEHERVSILQAHVDGLKTQLAHAEKALAEEVARQKPAPAPKPAEVAGKTR